MITVTEQTPEQRAILEEMARLAPHGPAQMRRDEAIANVRRHVVSIATRRGPLVLWDCAEPCPWNLRNVIRDYNWRRRGIVRPEEPTQ